MKHSMLVILTQILLVLAGCSSSELHPAKPMRQWESCTLFEPFEPGGDVPNEHYDPKLVANKKQEQDYIDCGRYKFEIPLEYDQSPDYALQQEFCEAVYTRGGVSKEAYEICITAYGQDDYKGFDMEDSESEETVVTAAELEERRQQGNSAPSGHVLGSSIGTADGFDGVLRRNPQNWCGQMPDAREFRKGVRMNLYETRMVLACATKAVTPVEADRKYLCDLYQPLFDQDIYSLKVLVKFCGQYEFPGDMYGVSNDDYEYFRKVRYGNPFLDKVYSPDGREGREFVDELVPRPTFTPEQIAQREAAMEKVKREKALEDEKIRLLNEHSECFVGRPPDDMSACQPYINRYNEISDEIGGVKY